MNSEMKEENIELAIKLLIAEDIAEARDILREIFKSKPWYIYITEKRPRENKVKTPKTEPFVCNKKLAVECSNEKFYNHRMCTECRKVYLHNIYKSHYIPIKQKRENEANNNTD